MLGLLSEKASLLHVIQWNKMYCKVYLLRSNTFNAVNYLLAEYIVYVYYYPIAFAIWQTSMNCPIYEWTACGKNTCEKQVVISITNIHELMQLSREVISGPTQLHNCSDARFRAASERKKANICYPCGCREVHIPEAVSPRRMLYAGCAGLSRDA